MLCKSTPPRYPFCSRHVHPSKVASSTMWIVGFRIRSCWRIVALCALPLRAVAHTSERARISEGRQLCQFERPGLHLMAGSVTHRSALPLCSKVPSRRAGKSEVIGLSSVMGGAWVVGGFCSARICAWNVDTLDASLDTLTVTELPLGFEPIWNLNCILDSQLCEL